MGKLSLEPSIEEVREKIAEILTEWEAYLCLDDIGFPDWETIKTFVDRQVEEEEEEQ